MSEENNNNEIHIEFDNNNDNDNDRNENWAIGIALIIVGGLFMLDSFNILNIHMHNWWAVFILAPGLTMVVNAYQDYQDTKTVDTSGLWGLLMIVFATALFFDISWNLIFPVGLIGVGLYMLISRD